MAEALPIPSRAQSAATTTVTAAKSATVCEKTYNLLIEDKNVEIAIHLAVLEPQEREIER